LRPVTYDEDGVAACFRPDAVLVNQEIEPIRHLMHQTLCKGSCAIQLPSRPLGLPPRVSISDPESLPGGVQDLVRTISQEHAQRVESGKTEKAREALAKLMAPVAPSAHEPFERTREPRVNRRGALLAESIRVAASRAEGPKALLNHMPQKVPLYGHYGRYPAPFRARYRSV